MDTTTYILGHLNFASIASSFIPKAYPIASMSGCTTIAANPDVSGIGVCMPFESITHFKTYAVYRLDSCKLIHEMLLMAVIPEIPGVTTPLLEVIASGAGISGLALLITAIVETAKGQLSLYHAIFIIHMLYFTGVMITPSGACCTVLGEMIVFSLRDIQEATRAPRPRLQYAQ